MNVLDDQDRRHPGRELAKQRSRYLVRARFTLNELAKLTARDLRHVDQRTKRPGREQWIAGAPQDARHRRLSVAETPQKQRLPDTSLTTDERETAASLVPHLGRPRRQNRERVLSLEECGRTFGCAQYRRDLNLPFTPSRD
jgi:hypothetical protein